MKYLKFIILWGYLMPFNANAQFYNNGAIVKITTGATLYSEGTITNTANSILTNNGVLETATNLVNSGTATLDGSGQYNIKANWENSSIFNAGTSTVSFVGASASTVKSGGRAFNILKVDKNVGSFNVTPLDTLRITGNLNFTQNSGKIILGVNHLILSAVATITGHDANRFIITDNVGKIVKQSLGTTPFTYPVGFNAATYNPLTVTQLGTIDDISVNCLEKVFKNGVSGAAFTQGVSDVSWLLTEGTAGGSNLSMTSQWAGTDELLSFTRTDCRISQHNGTNWDNSSTSAAGGSNPYNLTRTGITATGVFAVNSGSFLTKTAFEPSEGWQIGELYPNPISTSGDAVKLSITSPTEMSMKVLLIDNLGREIHYFDKEIVDGNNLFDFQTPKLTSGIYFLKIIADGQFIFKKLIVQ